MKRVYIFILMVMIFMSGVEVYGQEVDSTKFVEKLSPNDTLKKLGTLFRKNDVIRFSINTNLRALLADRDAENQKHTGYMTIDHKRLGPLTFPIRLQTRGNFRKNRENCAFPPLWLIFDGKEKDKTVFRKQDKVKLVTHCINEEYLHREYAVYKAFELISDAAFKTRSCEVTYIDSLGKKDTVVSYAFVIEPEEDIAIRKGWKEIENVKISQSSVDTLTMARIAVFEYMIGNTDWSVPAQHNIKLYVKNRKKVYAVPYDFDHSGLVSTSYATPHPMLGIESVEERIYRGIMYPTPVFEQVFTEFELVKSSLIALFQENNKLEERYKKFAVEYLEKFYTQIEDRHSIIKKFENTAMSSLKK